MVQLLMLRGADTETRNEEGLTPLHDAADRICRKAVLALLKHGAHANALGNHHEIPLHRLVLLPAM